MPSTDPTTKVAATRAALRLRLVTTGVTVLDYPADGQALPTPCWTVGIPSHEIVDNEVGARDVLGNDFEIGSWAWLMRWPVTLHTHLTTDATSTGVLDEQVGQLIAAIRSDVTLSGECLESVVTGVEHDLNDEDAPIRQHQVTATVVTLSKMPDA